MRTPIRTFPLMGIILLCLFVYQSIAVSPALHELKAMSSEDRLKNIELIKKDIERLTKKGVEAVPEPKEMGKEQAVKDFLENTSSSAERVESLEKRIVQLEGTHKFDKEIAEKKRALHRRIEAIEAEDRVNKENEELKPDKQMSTLAALEKTDGKLLMSHEETMAAQRRLQLDTIHRKAPLVRARYHEAVRNLFLARNKLNDLKRQFTRLTNLDKSFETQISRIRARIREQKKRAKFARKMKDQQLARETQATLAAQKMKDETSAVQLKEGTERKQEEDDKINESTDRMKAASKEKKAKEDEEESKKAANAAKQAETKMKNALAKLAAVKKAAAEASKRAADANEAATKADYDARSMRDKANALLLDAAKEQHRAQKHAALMELAEGSMERYEEKVEHLKQANKDFLDLAKEMGVEYKNALKTEKAAQLKAKRELAEEGVAYKAMEKAKRTAEQFRKREEVLGMQAQQEIDRAVRGKKVADWAKEAFEKAESLAKDMARSAQRATRKEEQDMAAAKDSRKASAQALADYQKFADEQQGASNGAGSDFVGALSSKVFGQAKAMVIKGINTAFQITDTIAHVLRFVAEAINMVSKVAPPPAQPPLIAAYKIADKIAKKIRKYADMINKNGGGVNKEEGKSGNEKAKELQGSKEQENASGNDREQMLAGRQNALKQTIKADIDEMRETFAKVQAEKATEDSKQSEASAKEKEAEEKAEEERVEKLKSTADKEKMKAAKAEQDSEKAQDVAADAKSMVKVKSKEVMDAWVDAQKETKSAAILQQKQADYLRKASVALKEAKKWMTKVQDYQKQMMGEKDQEKEHLEKFMQLRKKANAMLKRKMAAARLALKKHDLLKRFKIAGSDSEAKAIGANGEIGAAQRREQQLLAHASDLDRKAKDLEAQAATLQAQAAEADEDARKAAQELSTQERQVDKMMVTRAEQDKIAREARRKAAEFDAKANEAEKALAVAEGELGAVRKKKDKNDLELQTVKDNLEDARDKLAAAKDTRDQIKDELEDVEAQRKELWKKCKTLNCQ
eukprot:TRINITY_DN10735_c0_g1_i1.p1 TRINITY_DN10735_c0_g1~~TRINITY_DN10735_c0_g1_i1.p1  ORF type:complete len:1033 (+),score=440.64 TRINITY_DN10735_c0_g1_i1:225-3323(+)